jgi:hypothetical protein
MAASTPSMAALRPGWRASGANMRTSPSARPTTCPRGQQRPATRPAVVDPDDREATNEQQDTVEVGHRRQVLLPDAVVERFGGTQSYEGGTDQAGDPLVLSRCRPHLQVGGLPLPRPVPDRGRDACAGHDPSSARLPTGPTARRRERAIQSPGSTPDARDDRAKGPVITRRISVRLGSRHRCGGPVKPDLADEQAADEVPSRGDEPQPAGRRLAHHQLGDDAKPSDMTISSPSPWSPRSHRMAPTSLPAC